MTCSPSRCTRSATRWAWARAASAGSVMYGTYTGVMKGLASDDISGIRSIYSSNGPRTGGRV